jgi:mono/diheme cytochrome c family protein/glucose/arabinose dehydrogenase
MSVSLAAASCHAARSPEPSAAPAGSAAAPAAIPAINNGRVIAAIEDYSPQAPILPLSPEEEQKRFVLQPGYRLEPVLTEPDILEPAAIAFDGNGRMFVLELRTYMQDADATGELVPGGRISMHEDVDGDGVYERHTVFVDHLVFPRFVMPIGANSILTMESNEDDVYQYTDTDGDGVSDKKELFTTSFGRSGNVEHQQAFLYWGLDNWMYSTYNAFRIRWTPNGVIREPTGNNGAQWGVTQDDDGKIWFQGGASGVPSYFQFPIHYGNIRVPDQLEPGFQVPYGLAGVGDYQPGPTASRPDGTLNEVTGSAGNDVFRGTHLPAELRGDYFYGEPVARIVRRIRPVVTDGVTQLRNVYQGEHSEFIRSTDPLFRPIDLATAPDGTMYIVDVYRGIIQEGNWTQPGSHLRKKIDQYQLDKVINHGRIWRLTYEGMGRDTRKPRMLDESPAQLVTHLNDANGWWRDMAQQLLVLRQDRSVVPALQRMARADTSLLGRFHALWTLEGLGSLDAGLVRELLKDPEPRMRIQAVRASETLYKAGDRSLAADYRALARDADPDVVVQALLTLNVLKVPETLATLNTVKSANPARGVQLVAEQLAAPPRTAASFANRPPAERALLERGQQVYGELCSQCHGPEGEGTALASGSLMAPALAGSARVQGHRDYVIKTLLHGQTGPIEGKSYEGGVMIAMGDNSDEWVAAVASYIRTNLRNDATMVTPEEVAAVRAANAGRRTLWNHDELMATVPQLLAVQPTWKATASESAPTVVGGTAAPIRAFTFEGWTTGAPQRPGMWFQVELPEAVMLSEVQFASPGQPQPRPAPGVGAAPAPGARRGPPPPPRMTSPRAYRVEVSQDGTQWSAPVATGESAGTFSTIAFKPVQARFIRITQTGTAEDGASWSMQKLQLFGSPAR